MQKQERLLAYKVGRTLTNEEIAAVSGADTMAEVGPNDGSGTRRGPFYTDDGSMCRIDDYTYDIGD